MAAGGCPVSSSRDTARGGTVRRVTGKQVTEFPEAEFTRLRGRYRGVLLDVGTGDGKHALALARQRPDWLIIGLDANRDNMRRAARRAAARPGRGGQPNVLFIWAAAEHLPAALTGIDEVTVLMPWGSLLRGMLGLDGTILRELARVARPGASLLCTLNLRAWRPPVREVGDSTEPAPESAMATLGPVYARAGWALREAHYAGQGAEAHYSGKDAGVPLATPWSRRLGSAAGRCSVLVLRAERQASR
jgi:16S rRNA (adenine(1408)-N(1))-methyltransferase